MSQAQVEQSTAAAAADETSHAAGRWIRMTICFCTFGFIYPNAFVEGMDLTAIQRAHEGKLYD